MVVVFKNDPVEQLRQFFEVVMQVRQFELQILQTFGLFKKDPFEQLVQYIDATQVRQFELQVLQTLVVVFKNVPLLQKHTPDWRLN